MTEAADLPRMSRRISYKRQALFGILLLLTLTMAVEGAAQVRAHLFYSELCGVMQSGAVDGLDERLKRQICDDVGHLQYVFEDYKSMRPDQQYPTISINSHGFRGPEFEVPKPDGTYRVFVIGGSSVFGTGTVDNATIPAHLERMYREADLPFRVEVINAGILGAQSYIEHMLVKDKILWMDPDLLIVYDGKNDIGRAINNPGISGDILEEKDRNWMFYNIYMTYLNGNAVYEWAKKHSKIVSYVEHRGVKYNTDHDGSPILPKVAAWKERWGEICEIGKERGFEVLVTVQPVLGSGNQTMTAQHKALYTEQNGAGIAGKLHHYVDALEDMSPPCPFTSDLTHAFDGWVDEADGVMGGGGGGGGDGRVPISSAALLDLVHLSDYGNRIIASKMYDASIPIIMSGPVT